MLLIDETVKEEAFKVLNELTVDCRGLGKTEPLILEKVAACASRVTDDIVDITCRVLWTVSVTVEMS